MPPEETTMTTAAPARAILGYVPSPLWIAALGSLLLSVIAIYSLNGPNRDGMLYIETAEIFWESGFAAAKANFDWVFFPILIALFSKATALSFETGAYVLNALLMAGACAALVALTRRLFPQATWYGVIVALALPAYNNYRLDLIREDGYWLFSLLAIVCALRWQEKPTWTRGLWPQLCLFVAMLFRVEAAVYFSALALWALSQGNGATQRLRNGAMLVGLPTLGALLLLPVALTQAGIAGRVATYAAAANPWAEKAQFNLLARVLETQYLPPFSASEAASILFFGLASMAPKKFLLNNGVFLLPLLYALRPAVFRQRIAQWQPMGWFFATYFLTLLAFSIQQLFQTGRYVSFLNMLIVPLAALGFLELATRFPRGRIPMLAVAAVIALANVISLSPPKTHFREAGLWLKARPEMAAAMYLESSRSRYYAGKEYRSVRNGTLKPEEVEQAVAGRKYRYYVFEISKKTPGRLEWLKAMELQEIQRFPGRSGEMVVILEQRPG